MNNKSSQFEDRQKELQALEDRLRKRELLYRTDIRNWLGKVYLCSSPRIYDSLVRRLENALEEFEKESMRKPDFFKPYCPAALAELGSLHLMNQADGVKISIDPNKFTTNLGICGPQGAGKSRMIIHLCQELKRIDPNIRITILDPKAAFSNLTGFEQIDIGNASFDLAPPITIDLANFVYELMPLVADTAGLIYGLDLLNQAVERALEQRKHYCAAAEKDTSLCLRDILEALKSISVKGFRQAGYKDAAVTALSLIVGKQRLFSCRRGISLERLFNTNAVLNARCLTSEIQCRFFVTYLLYWLYQKARFEPETNRLRHVVIVDDALRFVGKTDNSYDNRINPLANLLAVLRTSGSCFCWAAQLVSGIDPVVLNFTRNFIVIGNINGEKNLRTIRGFMSLNNDQMYSLSTFKRREMLGFISGSNWSYPLHGWSPKVELSENTRSVYADDYTSMIEAWVSLANLPQTESHKEPEAINQTQEPVFNLQQPYMKLVWDCVNYLFNKVRDRTKRLDFSVRTYEVVKNEAVQNGFLLPSSAGKTVYLIPTEKAYEAIGQESPYQRNVSLEHSFYVQLAAHTLKQNPSLKVQMETPVGRTGATIDVTAIDKTGVMTAYEISLSLSNLLTNASKMLDTAYQKIVWLCRDAATAKAVKSYFNKSSSLPENFKAKFEYTYFSKFIKKEEEVN